MQPEPAAGDERGVDEVAPRDRLVHAEPVVAAVVLTWRAEKGVDSLVSAMDVTVMFVLPHPNADHRAVGARDGDGRSCRQRRWHRAPESAPRRTTVILTLSPTEMVALSGC